MAEDDPFADLGETLEEESDETASTEGTGSSDATTSEAVDDEPGPTSAATGDPTTDPAFTYEEAQQRPFYARESTIQAFDSWLNYELERELAERGYRNVVVREMTDALLRTVVHEDVVDDVVERFERAREGDEPEADD